MKKLMIAAAAAAMIAGVEASTDNTLPYVYQVRINLLTTKAVKCSGTTDYTYAIPCQQPGSGTLGANNWARTLDSYAICGYMFGCDDSCRNLENIAENYKSWDASSVKATSGIVLWDAIHAVPVRPAKTSDGKTFTHSSAWNTVVAQFFSFDVLDIIYPGSVSEMAFGFVGDAVFTGSDTKEYYHSFAIKGAGFGQYAALQQQVAIGYVAGQGYTYETRTAYAWLATSGNCAGYMTAPYVMTDGTVNEVNAAAKDSKAYQVLGWTCGDACGSYNGDSFTAAYGNWSIAYNAALSQAFGVSFASAIKPYVPDYVGFTVAQ